MEKWAQILTLFQKNLVPRRGYFFNGEMGKKTGEKKKQNRLLGRRGWWFWLGEPSFEHGGQGEVGLGQKGPHLRGPKWKKGPEGVSPNKGGGSFGPSLIFNRFGGAGQAKPGANPLDCLCPEKNHLNNFRTPYRADVAKFFLFTSPPPGLPRGIPFRSLAGPGTSGKTVASPGPFLPHTGLS